MILEQIKDEVAKELNPKMQASSPDGLKQLVLDEFVDTVAKRYATACVKASQEKIADNAKIMREYIPDFGNRTETKQIDKETFYSTKDTFYQIDKESVTSPDNIVLL